MNKINGRSLPCQKSQRSHPAWRILPRKFDNPVGRNEFSSRSSFLDHQITTPHKMIIKEINNKTIIHDRGTQPWATRWLRLTDWLTDSSGRSPACIRESLTTLAALTHTYITYISVPVASSRSPARSRRAFVSSSIPKPTQPRGPRTFCEDLSSALMRAPFGRFRPVGSQCYSPPHLWR